MSLASSSIATAVSRRGQQSTRNTSRALYSIATALIRYAYILRHLNILVCWTTQAS